MKRLDWAIAWGLYVAGCAALWRWLIRSALWLR